MFLGRSNKANKVARQQQKHAPKQEYFDDSQRTYSCIHCRAHLANHDELISKLFQGNHGRAYLFNKVVNISCKKAVERELLTGLHAVADIYCDSCHTTLGWKYEQAFVPSQKYKEGKYIIELIHILKENNWDLTSYNANDLIEDKQRLVSTSELSKDDLRREHLFTRFGARRGKKAPTSVKPEVPLISNPKDLDSSPEVSLRYNHSSSGVGFDNPNHNQTTRTTESTEVQVFSIEMQNDDSSIQLFEQSDELRTSLSMVELQSAVKLSANANGKSSLNPDQNFVAASGTFSVGDSQGSSSNHSSDFKSSPESNTTNRDSGRTLVAGKSGPLD